MNKLIALAVATLVVAGLASCTIPKDDADPAPANPAPAAPAEDTLEVEAETPAAEPEAPAEPALTLAQENAVQKGLDYLSYSGFSRSGLITQLEFEGFTNAEAVFAADYIAPNWLAEAEEKAKSYMEYSSFSSSGLYDQLIFEGFTDAEAKAGLAAVGY